MSDIEAVAKLLKVCQWVFASELKDTLRLARTKRSAGPTAPCQPTPPPLHRHRHRKSVCECMCV
ncbi:Hypothetical predicted protein [Scomber scombrus]|uniref:Uncharacterized protein n=1 Tax=Scomber scombrus TaxID=13677 RepID=A0AAV1PLS9_SCOSC